MSEPRTRRVPWRVGRKLKRTVYEQVFIDRPDDGDRFLGIFDSPEVAAYVVELHNAQPYVVRG